ncbi:1-aminocyclopropane-1-carboxylate deaminase/D-cysteine desulfhydrase [Hymenobacter caeli]|uniref:1-aminocyclopropane-1-carboxylate deaminase/D-cysteine desulfhydrase-like pyridoxal-dependent ACC family enzyme n=1 Tax=Hymenobacter caeli TaxID=2735894 RepID=A0ABX2FLB6_9BACT|nr:pyridoxal-phosphate dependent enzyme [Hymenobacter caeli]NRT17923.1 1-aminocyclopropane-1-carboxylate deaminase/D-cysteine desulfhydrase-like pyridoxal-dependent ACC family enzyme [Hymenobacter caeli]
MPSNPFLQDLPEPVATAAGVRLLLWRDDLVNPALPGNKARKLKYNLREARRLGRGRLLTFGGAYSNHLAAVATAGRLHGLATVGLVRGEATGAPNPTLARCAADGMALHYLDRAAYRRRAEPAFLAEMLRQFGPAYPLPEGGTNALALPGVAELAAEIRQCVAFDALAVAVGTGGTLAGLLGGLAGPETALGVAALKNGGFLRRDVDALTLAATGRAHTNYGLATNYHFGGYAKYSADLLAFIHGFEARHGVLLDPIYTGKLLFGVLDLIGQGHFRPGSTVVAIHTGGLQAWAGWHERFGGGEGMGE